MNINTKNRLWTIKNMYGDIKRTQRFKLLGEILIANYNEEAAIEEIARKMETVLLGYM